MREPLAAALHAIGYVVVTSAAVWLLFRYLPG